MCRRTRGKAPSGKKGGEALSGSQSLTVLKNLSNGTEELSKIWYLAMLQNLIQIYHLAPVNDKNNNNTFFTVRLTIVWTLINTNVKQFKRWHYGSYWLQALQAHRFSKYKSFIRTLNLLAFLDDFISFGREFQIFGPKMLIDFIP